jgi:hypothetical protein
MLSPTATYSFRLGELKQCCEEGKGGGEEGEPSQLFRSEYSFFL